VSATAHGARRQLLTAPRLLLGDQLVGPGWVELAGDRIVAAGAGPPPRAADVRLATGLLSPGLIDLQLNGAFGVDFGSADSGEWQSVSRQLPSTGVTSFVPTIITAPFDQLMGLLRSYRSLRGTLEGGARSLGMHVEGPFLAPARRGAHRAELFSDPSPELIGLLIEAGGDALAYVTLAPEREGALEAIGQLTASGVRVAVGHTDATAEQVRAAADAGAAMVTHLYNAQRPLHHRDPGVVGAALSDARLTVGLIVDGHHVAPTAVAVAFAAAGGRIALVTDAIAALGMAPGRYELGGEGIEVREGAPPVRDTGTLAGSAVRLDDAVAKTVEAGVPLDRALLAATRVPADVLGRTDLGRIAVGALADLVWLDADLRTASTWIEGNCAYVREDARAPLGDVEATLVSEGSS
jgi:N-acetylglucosamine-6-phosphate deacetylase